MLIYRYLFASLCILVVTGCPGYQHPGPIYQKILPGDPSIQANRIKPHKIKYEKIGASMVYNLRLLPNNGLDTYQLTIDFQQNETSNPDTIYFDPQTLGYTARHLTTQDYSIDVKFSNGHFTGQLIPAKGSGYTPVVFEKSYQHGAFEPAVINYFIVALPLELGYTASLPIFDLNKGSQLLWANIKVLGQETLTINGQEIETWKVSSDGVRKKIIWLSNKYPYAIKMQTEGTFGSWEISSVE